MLSKIARARAGSWATFLALALAALLVDLGAIHRLEHADAIVPVLVSLQRWTPFYWDQDRYGMLVPLLALPVRDPLWNLLLQRGLLVLAGLSAVVLLARHVLYERDWRVAGALSAAALLAVPTPAWRFEFLGDQPYGLSLALALAGLAFAEPVEGGRRGPARLGAGLLLCAAAHWVNAAAGLLLLPLALARAAVDRLEGAPASAVRDRVAVDAALLAAGLAAGQALLRLEPLVSGGRLRQPLGTLPVAAWPGAWAALLGNAWRAAGAWPWVLSAVAIGGLVLLVLPAHRALLPRALLRAGALCLAALAYALATGTLSWVAANGYHWRYLAPAAVLVHLAAVSLLAEPLARRGGPWAVGAAVALVPSIALAISGAPSLARVRADLDGAAGDPSAARGPDAAVTARRSADVLAAGCVLITGDYWSVWPAVFHAAMVERDRGHPPARVYGLSFRADPTAPAWSGLPRPSLRICRIHGEEDEAERQLRGFHLWPVRVVERRSTVDVLLAAPE